MKRTKSRKHEITQLRNSDLQRVIGGNGAPVKAINGANNPLFDAAATGVNNPLYSE
jgi:hypothetical protein